MSNVTWLFIAFTAVWVGIGAYLLSIAVRQRKLERAVEELARNYGGPRETPRDAAE